MTEETHLKNIAVVGAGNLGSLVIQSLIATKRFNITIISRSGSSSKFPTDPSVIIKQGDYGSPSFLSSAFAGQEAAILTLHHSAVPNLEITLIEAAAAGGVKWILPVEYGNDNANEDLVKLIPINEKKTGPRTRIEELAKKHEGLKWIGVITNPWFDMVNSQQQRL
jgi:saccharopine dehydrogenase-like NADP-dependent oxidoreductase